MGLLQLEDTKLILDPNVLAIPVVRKIYDRDPDEQKPQAYKELMYVYYVCDFKSPYSNYPEEEREFKVRTDFMGEDWQPDEELKDLMKEYQEMQVMNSPSLRLLYASREAVHKLAGWLKDVEYTGSNATAPKDVAMTLEKVGKIIESLNKIEDKVKKEITTTSRARGGGVTGLYEK